MSRYILTLIFFTSLLTVCGQEVDTLGRRHSIEGRFGTIANQLPAIVSPAQLRELSDLPVLSRDFSQFTEQVQMYQYHSEVYLALNYYHKLYALRGFSWSAGLLFRETAFGGVYYEYDTIYPVDVLSGGSGNQLVQYTFYSESHSFAVTGMQLVAPVGLHWSTNPDRRLSFQAGITLAPGASFGHQLEYHSNVRSDYVYAPPGEEPDENGPAVNNSNDFVRNNTSLKGVGLSSSASLPLFLYVRLFKSQRFYGRVRLSAGIEPAFSYQKYRNLPAQSVLVTRLSLGLRYSL